MKKSSTSKGVYLSENKQNDHFAITKKDIYLFFFYDLFIATLAYYLFKIKPTMFYEMLRDDREYSLSIVDEKVEVEVIFSSVYPPFI